MARCFQLPCINQNGGLMQNNTEMLVVSCDNYIVDGRNCRGACSVGMVAGTDTCETCEKWTEPKSLGLMEQVRSIATAMTSRALQKEATPEVQAGRLNMCRVCPHLDPSAVEGEVGYCKACGCPKGKYSELTFKARILVSTCPKTIWDGITYQNPPPAYPQPAQADAPSTLDAESPTIPAPRDAETP